MKGKTTKSDFNGFLNSTAPTRAVTKTNKNWTPIAKRFSGDRTFAERSAAEFHEKLGLGTMIPKSAEKIRANPRMTTVQSSLIMALDLEDDIILYS
ncbi:hypothetical protein D3C81_1130620 [compost metagenome]